MGNEAERRTNNLKALEPVGPVTRSERARPVNSCTSTSSRSCVSCAWGIASMGIAARVSRERDGSLSHVAVDDHSRAAYAEVLPDQTGATTTAFLRRTIRWFARRGVIVHREEVSCC